MRKTIELNSYKEQLLCLVQMREYKSDCGVKLTKKGLSRHVFSEKQIVLFILLIYLVTSTEIARI